MEEEIESKLKKKNKILFSRDSICLQQLIHLIEKQKHRTLILWAFDCVQLPLQWLHEKYPEEKRPQKAIQECQKWAQGKVKMPIAKKAILQAHSVAKQINDPIGIALCHAVGQAGSTVHVETHALGLVFYELTALVLSNKEEYSSMLEEKIQYYLERLQYWEKQIEQVQLPWADFLLEDRPNKEKILNEKRRTSQ